MFVPGNHSGFANLEPGNPATVDPPILDDDLTHAEPPTRRRRSPAGTTSMRSPTSSSTRPRRRGSRRPASAVWSFRRRGRRTRSRFDWQAICHAADYVIYRGYNPAHERNRATAGWIWTSTAPATGSAYGTVSTPFSATLPDNSSGDPTSTTDVVGRRGARADLPRHGRGRHGSHRAVHVSGERGRVSMGAEPVLRTGACGGAESRRSVTTPRRRTRTRRTRSSASVLATRERNTRPVRRSSFQAPRPRWFRVIRSTSTTTLTRTPRSSTSTRRSIPLARSPARPRATSATSSPRWCRDCSAPRWATIRGRATSIRRTSSERRRPDPRNPRISSRPRRTRRPRPAPRRRRAARAMERCIRRSIRSSTSTTSTSSPMLRLCN